MPPGDANDGGESQRENEHQTGLVRQDHGERETHEHSEEKKAAHPLERPAELVNPQAHATSVRPGWAVYKCCAACWVRIIRLT